MNAIAIAWRYLWSRPLATVLNVLLLTLGLASITFVLLARHQIDRAFERDLQGIDLVVGAKGSPLQLILSGVFHIDIPPGNVALADVQALADHPQVAQVIPLSLGDSFRGFRIVGTTADYVRHYSAQLAAGTLWTAPMQVVLGAQAAAATGLPLGAAFAGMHGLVSAPDGSGSGHVHEASPYTVVGQLAPCGCVLDRLMLTATESVWQVHEDAHTGTEPLDAEDRAALEAEREVTVALVRYRTPLAAASLPRWVNQQTAMQAAAPAMEVTRLLQLLGTGAQVLQALGLLLLGTAGLSVFIALWAALRERRADLALLRLLGAPPRRLAALLLAEALLLAVLALALGLLLGHGLTALLGYQLAAQRSIPVQAWQWADGEWAVLLLALGVAVLAAVLPAWAAYRTDAARQLNASA